jgi:hypothetical protein
MGCLVVPDKKFRINLIERWGCVLLFAHNHPTINVAEYDVKFVGLIGESPIIIKNALTFPAMHSRGNANRFDACICGK